MGAQLAQQPSTASASFKSPVHMPPVMLPPQATCTASVSLRRQDLRAPKSRVRACLSARDKPASYGTAWV
jgi:hypothetical protein